MSDRINIAIPAVSNKALKLTICSLEFLHIYENVKKIITELPNGLTEIYPDHVNLSSTIPTGKLLIFEEVEKKLICKTYIIQVAVLNIIKKGSLYNPKGNLYNLTEVMIFGYRIVPMDDKNSFIELSVVEQQIQKYKNELNSIFNFIENTYEKKKIQEFNTVMKTKFYGLQKELTFWEKVKAQLDKTIY